MKLGDFLASARHEVENQPHRRAESHEIITRPSMSSWVAHKTFQISHLSGRDTGHDMCAACLLYVKLCAKYIET